MGILDRIFGRKRSQPEPTPAAQARAAGGANEDADKGADEDGVVVNAYATVRELPPIDFPHQPFARRDLSDPELAPHLNGFTGYVMGRGDGQMTAMRYHLWRHVQRVRNQASMMVRDEDLPAMEDWARRANAVLFLPDGSVRAPDLAVLMTADGEFGDPAGLPYPADAVERRARSLARLDAMSPKPPASMPPSLGEAEAVLRPAPAVLERVLALFCVAEEGIALGDGSQRALPLMRERNPLGVAALSPQERAFVDAETPDAHAAIQMSWRYEALNVLLWALTPGSALESADAVVDAQALARQLLEIAKDGSARDKAALRPTADILDLLDLTWRQHWIVRQARQQGQDAIDGLNPGVVMERHYALNWLTGFQNDLDAGWDDIDTPS